MFTTPIPHNADTTITSKFVNFVVAASKNKKPIDVNRYLIYFIIVLIIKQLCKCTKINRHNQDKLR